MTRKKAWEFGVAVHHGEGLEARIADLPGCTETRWDFHLITARFKLAAADPGKAIAAAIADIRRLGGVPAFMEHPAPYADVKDVMHLSGLSWERAFALASAGEDAERFPRPVARVTSDRPLWDFHDVAEWLLARKMLAVDKAELVFAATRADAALRGGVAFAG